MMRRPINVQKNTRAIPSAPLRRSSNRPSPIESVWGAPRFAPTADIRRVRTHVASGQCVRQREDVFLDFLAVVLDSIVHKRKITNMLLCCKLSLPRAGSRCNKIFKAPPSPQILVQTFPREFFSKSLEVDPVTAVLGFLESEWLRAGAITRPLETLRTSLAKVSFDGEQVASAPAAPRGCFL